jgi:hypothetical protein
MDASDKHAIERRHIDRPNYLTYRFLQGCIWMGNPIEWRTKLNRNLQFTTWAPSEWCFIASNQTHGSAQFAPSWSNLDGSLAITPHIQFRLYCSEECYSWNTSFGILRNGFANFSWENGGACYSTGEVRSINQKSGLWPCGGLMGLQISRGKTEARCHTIRHIMQSGGRGRGDAWGATQRGYVRGTGGGRRGRRGGAWTPSPHLRWGRWRRPYGGRGRRRRAGSVRRRNECSAVCSDLQPGKAKSNAQYLTVRLKIRRIKK